MTYRLFTILAMVLALAACSSRDAGRGIDAADVAVPEETEPEPVAEIAEAEEIVGSPDAGGLYPGRYNAAEWDSILEAYIRLCDEARASYDPGEMVAAGDFGTSSDDCTGVVVYEGSGDYYIVETSLGYTVLEVYSGALWEDDYVCGELNSYNWHTIINRTRGTEVRVYVEDFMLSYSGAKDWLGRNDRLRYWDQEAYDSDDDDDWGF